MGFRLFISHSSPSTESAQRLTVLKEALEQRAGPGTIRVLLDVGQIEGGDDWRRRIAFMLHACHAAIVILDDAAIDSEWVLAECTVLSLRNRVDPSFRFIPVTYLERDTVTAEDLEAARQDRAARRKRLREGSWRVVDLDRIQDARGKEPAEVADMVIGTLSDQGQLIAHESPVDLLALQLTGHFKTVNPVLLDVLAEAFGEDQEYLSDDRTTRTVMALTRNLVSERRLLTVRTKINDKLGVGFSNVNLALMLNQLAPLLIDPDAAAALTCKRTASAHVHACLRTAQPAQIVPWVLARAYLPARKRPLVIENSDGDPDSLRDALRQAWCKANPGKSAGRSADYVDSQIRLVPRYVSVPGPITAEVLAELDADYPNVSFLIHQVSPITADSLPAAVTPLLPALEPEEEDRLIADYDAATDSLEEEEW